MARSAVKSMFVGLLLVLVVVACGFSLVIFNPNRGPSHTSSYAATLEANHSVGFKLLLPIPEGIRWELLEKKPDATRTGFAETANGTALTVLGGGNTSLRVNRSFDYGTNGFAPPELVARRIQFSGGCGTWQVEYLVYFESAGHGPVWVSMGFSVADGFGPGEVAGEDISGGFPPTEVMQGWNRVNGTFNAFDSTSC